MSEVKTLVILTPGFAANEADTTCLPFLQNFIIACKEQFPLLDIEVLALDYPFTSGRYNWKSNSIYAFNGYKKRGLKKIWKWIMVWRKLDQLRKQKKVIGVLSLWYGECAFVGKTYSKRKGLAHFCWLLGQDAKANNKYVHRTKLPGSDLIAISYFIQKEFEEHYNITPQQIIPISINTKLFNTAQAERNIDVLAVGSLIPLKQYDLFIDSIHHLKKQFPGIKAVLCGKGEEEKKLLDQIKRNGLQENITLTGELPHGEVLQLMQRSRIFLHPSTYEGFSAVCLEALYAGTHVVSFCKATENDVPNWHIVQSKEEMLQKTSELLHDTTLNYQSTSVSTIEQTAQQLLQLYNYKEVASS